MLSSNAAVPNFNTQLTSLVKSFFVTQETSGSHSVTQTKLWVTPLNHLLQVEGVWDAALDHSLSGTLVSLSILKLCNKSVLAGRKWMSCETLRCIIPPDCALNKHFYPWFKICEYFLSLYVIYLFTCMAWYTKHEEQHWGFLTVCCQSGQLLWLHMHGVSFTFHHGLDLCHLWAQFVHGSYLKRPQPLCIPPVSSLPQRLSVMARSWDSLQ